MNSSFVQPDLVFRVTSPCIDLTFSLEGAVQNDFLSPWTFEVCWLWICTWSHYHRSLSLSVLYSHVSIILMWLSLWLCILNGVSVVQNSFYHLRDTFWSSEKKSEWYYTESASGWKERTSASFRRICGRALVPALSLTTLVKLGTLPNSVNLSLFIWAMGLMISDLGTWGMNTVHAKWMSRLYRMPVIQRLTCPLEFQCTALRVNFWSRWWERISVL